MGFDLVDERCALLGAEHAVELVEHVRRRGVNLSGRRRDPREGRVELRLIERAARDTVREDRHDRAVRLTNRLDLRFEVRLNLVDRNLLLRRNARGLDRRDDEPHEATVVVPVVRPELDRRLVILGDTRRTRGQRGGRSRRRVLSRLRLSAARAPYPCNTRYQRKNTQPL